MMILLMETVPDRPIRPRSTAREEFVCWSRMQAEAGQGLDAIIERKERERQAGDGVFFWGVGNAPAAIASVLARADIPVRAIFSVMKSRPKSVDVSPARTVVWRRYLDAYGVERPLPPHALVTSRGDSASGVKRIHHALMCRSDEPLTLRRGERFDPTAFRNAGGTGAPVGSSQVTALLRRVAAQQDTSDYEVNLSAWLTGGYWVRLTDAVELNAEKIGIIAGVGEIDVPCWRAAVAVVRQDSSGRQDGASEAGPLI